jgi:predicted outer membrane repeat protein
MTALPARLPSSSAHDVHRRGPCRFAWLAAALIYGAPCAPALAAILTVGAPGTGCNHTTIQAAIEVANDNPGADTIRIARSATWTAQQLVVDTHHEISLVGGYATCTSAAPDGTQTILSGAGGGARPVLTVRGNGFVFLRNLTIRDGDQAGNDNGGGISFEGGGILDIADTDIIENSARNGGGIYATGTTLQAELVLGANVTVGFNTARDSGGGVFAKDIEMSLLGPGSSLLFNVAQGQGSAGRGGGLVVLASQLKAYAYISSNGIGGLGAVYANEAVDGGGIAVLGGEGADDEAEVWIYSTDGANPVRINANIATSRGGAIYARPEAAALPFASAPARAKLWYVDLDDNQAPDGAAVFLDYDNFGIDLETGGELSFNIDRPPNAVACPQGRPCGSISNNTTGNTGGSIIEVTDNSNFNSARLRLQDNGGGRLIDMPTPGSSPTFTSLRNSVITGNEVAQELIRAPDDAASVELYHVTVADNTIGAPHVLSVNERLELIHSLISQPGKLTVAAGTSDLQVVQILTNDQSNLPIGPAALAAPRFIDPANGDYRLRAGSRGVDYAATNTSEALDGILHNIDLPNAGITAPARVADVGAYERTALLPLVLNADFDASLNLWAGSGLADSFWDGTQNAAGPAGSGSARVVFNTDPKAIPNGPRLAGVSQCVHLPGPGLYQLNGWGRVVPGSNPPLTSNRARLVWELRYNGGRFGCSDGAPDFGGTHQLATGTAWTRPGSPAVIEVPAAVWTQDTSLTIKLDVLGGPINPPTAWFDGITLDLLGDDTIFANGFQ